MLPNIRFALAAIFITLLFSCSKVESSVDKDTPAYLGTMTVEYKGESFVSENVSVQVAKDDSGKTIDIKLNKVKFVPAMPVRIDVTIPDVPLGEDMNFSGDGIVPYALGGPYKKFIVTGLTGKMTENGISFSLKFGDYPTSYSGTL